MAGRLRAAGAWLGLAAAMAFASQALGQAVDQGAGQAAGQAATRQTRVERVSFPPNDAPQTKPKPERLNGVLHLPEGAPPFSVVVITPSSGGEKPDREGFYADQLARGGIAALEVESFRSRGLTNSVRDQSVLSSFESENDAAAALKWLAADPRFRPDRIGVTGVSKGGAVALNSAFAVRRRWTRTSAETFAAHAPIAPPCGFVPDDPRTTGAPIFFMLAELDDQTPAAPCINLAELLRRGGHTGIALKVYEGAHHGWETAGTRPYFDPLAQNFRGCRGTITGDGAMRMRDGPVVPGPQQHAFLRDTCMSLGTHCCGGNQALREEAARDLVAFFRRSGF